MLAEPGQCRFRDTSLVSRHSDRAPLDQGLAAGLTVGHCKEILVQLYAYAGLPRSLNALGEFMKVLERRKERGITDRPGGDSGPVPVGDELLAVGTANPASRPAWRCRSRSGSARRP